ncbi:hypothetical protein E4U21_005743 [Claviceps maximensis]|nr:hypothetical protein E4U21_005743 [Claviceps maximensis]
MRFLHPLSKALPLLLLLSTVCAIPNILVDPVLMSDDEANLRPTHDGPEIHVASFRKEVVHKNNEFRRENKVANSDTEVVRHDGKEAHIDFHDESHDTYVSLINATPYRWHLVYSHSYQLKRWNHEWPTWIMPGASVTVRVNNFGYGKKALRDSAGEVTYELLKTKKPASFQVQYRPGKQHSVWVQFRDQLKTPDTVRLDTARNLGFSREPGGVGFMLAGTEGDFVSNNGPVQWMQSQLSEIGNLSLREILLPRSHQSGMWTCAFGLGPEPDEGFGSGPQPGGGFGIGPDLAGNIVTQNLTLFHQLRDGGVRVIDYRPMMWRRRLHAGHGSFFAPGINAIVGAPLDRMIHDCNKFTRQYPGELIIWDIHDPVNGDLNYKGFNDANMLTLWSKLMKINWRIALPLEQDVTRRPLNFFISPDVMAPGRSSVLIRVPASWTQFNGYPGIKHGFVTSDLMPLNSRSSNTYEPDKMFLDQLKHLNESRPSRDSVMHNMDWVLDQTRLIRTPIYADPIIDTSRGTWPALFGRLWRALSDTRYPNMISLDYIQGDSLKTMAMVVNKCFAARRCGPLGGKVKPIPEEEDADPDETGFWDAEGSRGI